MQNWLIYVLIGWIIADTVFDLKSKVHSRISRMSAPDYNRMRTFLTVFVPAGLVVIVGANAFAGRPVSPVLLGWVAVVLAAVEYYIQGFRTAGFGLAGGLTLALGGPEGLALLFFVFDLVAGLRSYAHIPTWLQRSRAAHHVTVPANNLAPTTPVVATAATVTPATVTMTEDEFYTGLETRGIEAYVIRALRKSGKTHLELIAMTEAELDGIKNITTLTAGYIYSAIRDMLGVAVPVTNNAAPANVAGQPISALGLDPYVEQKLRDQNFLNVHDVESNLDVLDSLNFTTPEVEEIRRKINEFKAAQAARAQATAAPATNNAAPEIEVVNIWKRFTGWWNRRRKLVRFALILLVLLALYGLNDATDFCEGNPFVGIECSFGSRFAPAAGNGTPLFLDTGSPDPTLEVPLYPETGNNGAETVPQGESPATVIPTATLVPPTATATTDPMVATQLACDPNMGYTWTMADLDGDGNATVGCYPASAVDASDVDELSQKVEDNVATGTAFAHEVTATQGALQTSIAVTLTALVPPTSTPSPTLTATPTLMPTATVAFDVMALCQSLASANWLTEGKLPNGQVCHNFLSQFSSMTEAQAALDQMIPQPTATLPLG